MLYSKEITDRFISIDNALQEARIIFQKSGKGDINHKLENIIYTIMSAVKNLKTELRDGNMIRYECPICGETFTAKVKD